MIAIIDMSCNIIIRKRSEIGKISSRGERCFRCGERQGSDQVVQWVPVCGGEVLAAATQKQRTFMFQVSSDKLL